MGMYGTLWRITEADVQELTRYPDRVETFLFGEPAPEIEERSGLLGLISRFSPIKIYKPMEWTPDAPWGHTRAREELDLEKAWHGLHCLFTGTAWEGDEPACFLVRGGDELDTEIGDSTPRLLRPPQVRAFTAFLAQLSKEELMRRYDPARMMRLEIYPEVWQRQQDAEGADTVSEDLLNAFDNLKRFVETADREGDSIVILVG